MAGIPTLAFRSTFVSVFISSTIIVYEQVSARDKYCIIAYSLTDPVPVGQQRIPEDVTRDGCQGPNNETDGRLAVPKTLKDLIILAEMAAELDSKSAIIGAYKNASEYMWIDGEDLPSDHAWWQSEEPKSSGENVAVMRKGTGYLKIESGSSELPMICEHCVGTLGGEVPSCVCVDESKEEDSDVNDRFVVSDPCPDGCKKLTFGNTCHKVKVCSEDEEDRSTDECPEDYPKTLSPVGHADSFGAFRCGHGLCPGGKYGSGCRLSCLCDRYSSITHTTTTNMTSKATDIAP